MKRFGSFLAAATCVVSFAMSAPTQAATFQHFECMGAAPIRNGSATCLVPFELNDFNRPYSIGTHANFHAGMARGTITMDWYDGGQLVGRWVCQAPGMFVGVGPPSGGQIGTGPGDLATTPNCASDVEPEAAFALGDQLLVVTAQANSCMIMDRDQSSCPFHGFLQLGPAAATI